MASKQRKNHSLAQITARFGGDVVGDAKTRISRVATLESARAGDLAFLAQPRYLSQLAATKASAVIVGPGAAEATKLPRIVASNPYAYFAAVSAFLNPPRAFKAGRHRSAVADRSARIARTAAVGACAVIGKRVRIGERAVIGAGCVIGDDVTVGADTLIYPNVTVYHGCVVGLRCIVHSGVVIGADGFGIANDAGVWKKVPQIGRVRIGDDVEIGANTTIDRGALDDTVIEDGVKLDNQIQIAHNVHIGAHTAIAACVGIAGSAHIGRGCTLGGAAMIQGHITIADGVNVSAGTLILRSLEGPGTYTGIFPFSSHRRWLRNAAQLRKLDELAERLSALEDKQGKAERD